MFVRIDRFLDYLHQAERDRKLPFALAERVGDTTNTFHLPFSELTLALMEFSFITGIRVGGKPIP